MGWDGSTTIAPDDFSSLGLAYTRSYEGMKIVGLALITPNHLRLRQ
jgi:hypothetical protein